MAVHLCALELGRRLLALPEPLMRRQTLCQILQQLGDDQVVALLGELCLTGRASVEAEVALLSLAAVLEHEDLGYERQAALYERASSDRDEIVARLLLCSGRQPGSSRAPAAPQSEPTQPLGWRKSFARSPRREVIDRLLRDPDPSVLAILLENPRVIERDAVQLAARRPTTAAAQRIVFASRYAARFEVRRALVLNPFTAADLSARLLPSLAHGDLVEVAERSDLAESLRSAAAALLRQRGPTSDPQRA